MKFRFDFLLTQSSVNSDFELRKNIFIAVNPDGKISEYRPWKKSDSCDKHFKELILPGLVNAHSHGFQIGMRGYADNPRNFADWVNRFLYPMVEKTDEHSFRFLMKSLYKQMIENGVTTLGEFHYVHHGNDAKNYEFDQIILEEAKKIGIRLSLLQSTYDITYQSAQHRFYSSENSFQHSLDRIEDWMKKHGKEDQWSLSVAPHSLHACSPNLLRSSVKWANKRNLKWHIHLAEQKSDIAYSQKKYETTPLFALQAIIGDLLTSNACLVHAVWLSLEEIKLFRKLNLNLIYNPMTNMYLGDGITPINEMKFGKERKIALGTDSNNAFNMFNEAKAMEGLQRIASLQMGNINSHQLLASITSFSGELLNLKTGLIKSGYFADFIEMNFEERVTQSIQDFSVSEIINHLIFSGFERADINAVYIGGKAYAVSHIKK